MYEVNKPTLTSVFYFNSPPSSAPFSVLKMHIWWWRECRGTLGNLVSTSLLSVAEKSQDEEDEEDSDEDSSSESEVDSSEDGSDDSSDECEDGS